MVPQVDLAEEAAPSRLQVVLGWAVRHRRLLILVAVLAVLHVPLLLIARQIGTPSLLLFACLVSGFGLTYFSGIDLIFEERLFFGTVIGAMAVSLAGFLAASLLGFGVTSVSLGAAVALGLSAIGWFRGRRQGPCAWLRALPESGWNRLGVSRREHDWQIRELAELLAHHDLETLTTMDHMLDRVGARIGVSKASRAHLDELLRSVPVSTRIVL